jgi:aminocarboxymuconate-semialdehyde decarboxylase
MQNISKKPSEYLRAFYYDTCLYDTRVLAALIAVVGADRVVMGSDYPVGETDPIGFVERCPGITGDEVAMITGGTAARLLRLGKA